MSSVRAVLSLTFVGLLAACATVQQPESAPGARDAPPELSVPSERGPQSLRKSPLKEPPGVFNSQVKQGNINTTIASPAGQQLCDLHRRTQMGLKHVMLARAGLDASEATKYELDHFVPLALGGHPRSDDNLWLQPWDGAWNARIKGRLERTLQVMVCAGKLTLHAARTAIQHGWRAAYRKYIAVDPSVVPRGYEIDGDEVVE